MEASVVSLTTFISMFFTLLFSIGLPVLALVFLCRKEQYFLRYFGVGLLGFFIFQMCLRLPLFSLLPIQRLLSSLPFFITLFIAAFSAALFETTGRFIGFSLFLKYNRSYRNGIAAGIGHGLAEVLCLIVPVYLNNFILIFLLNTQGPEALTTLGLSSEQASLITKQLIETPALHYLASGAERIMAVSFHVLCSVLLLRFVIRGTPAKGFLLVLILHTALDSCVPLLASFMLQPLLLIALTLSIAAVFCFITYKLGQAWSASSVDGHTRLAP